MIQELYDASNMLKIALERYLSACTTVGNQYSVDRTLRVNNSHSRGILNEFQHITSYRAIMNHCERALNRFRNCCTEVAPINTLPSEILTYIFRLASMDEQCFLWDIPAQLKSPSRCPESLLYVCSYWRSVALDSHALWTHVDLTPLDISNGPVWRFGQRFADQAGQSLLDLHVDLEGKDPVGQHKIDLLDFCASVATRARSFQLDYSSFTGLALCPILDGLFANAIPGNLSKLTIAHNYYAESQRLIVARNSQGSPSGDDWMLDVPHSHFEEVLLHVTVLRLDGIYPSWTSQAYSGLVKLHLTDTSGEFIKVSQLARVLRASPQLRFLYFGTGVVEDDLPDVVCLRDLQVLTLEFRYPNYGSVLRLITPGSKPLQMTTTSDQDELTTLTEGEYSNFIARANITRLWVNSMGYRSPIDLPNLLALAPNLQDLALYGFDIQQGNSISPGLTDGKGSPSAQLTYLRLAYSSIDPGILRWVTETYPTIEVTIQERMRWVENENREPHGPRGWREEVIETFPSIKFVDKIVLPVEDWD